MLCGIFAKDMMGREGCNILNITSTSASRPLTRISVYSGAAGGATTPMGRFGRPAELTGALLFLLDNEASGFITGVVLPVKGGFMAYSGV